MSCELLLSECDAEVDKLSCGSLCPSLDSLSNVGEHSKSQSNPNLFENKFANATVSKPMDCYLPKNKGKGKKLLNSRVKKHIDGELNQNNRNVIESSNKYSLFSLQLTNENLFNFQPNSNQKGVSYKVEVNKENSNDEAYQLEPLEQSNIKNLKKQFCIVESSLKSIRGTSNVLNFYHPENSGDTCVVSSSTGQLDPNDFHEQSSSSNSSLNPPILDSTVDSTSEQNYLISSYSEDNEISQKRDDNGMGFVSLDESKCNMGISLSSKTENHDLNMSGSHDDGAPNNQQFIDILSLNNFNLRFQSSIMHDKHNDKKNSSTIENLSTNFNLENPGFSNVPGSLKKVVHETNNYTDGPLVNADDITYKDNPLNCKLIKSLSQIKDMKIGISKVEPEISILEGTPNMDNSVLSVSCQELDVTGNKGVSNRSLIQSKERYIFNVGENSTSGENGLCLDPLPDIGTKFHKNILNKYEHLKEGDESLESYSKHVERISNYETVYDMDLESQQLGNYMHNQLKSGLLPSLLLEEQANNETALKINCTISNSPNTENNSSKDLMKYIVPSSKDLSLQHDHFRQSCQNNCVDPILQEDEELTTEVSEAKETFFSTDGDGISSKNYSSNNVCKISLSSNKRKELKIICSNVNDQSTLRIAKGQIRNQKRISITLGEESHDDDNNCDTPYEFNTNCRTPVETGSKDGDEILLGEGCPDCENSLRMKCSLHQIQTILDKPVPSRAKASLPVQYLFIKPIFNEDKKYCNGIFSRKMIPKRTQFGPVEGHFCLEVPSQSSFYFKVTRRNTQGFIDTSDESSSNWMRFVRPAQRYSEINCIVIEEKGSIYFLTTLNIRPKTELKIWYSKEYARRYNLPRYEESEFDGEDEQARLSCGMITKDEAVSLHSNDDAVVEEKKKGCLSQANVKTNFHSQRVKRRFYDCIHCDLSFNQDDAFCERSRFIKHAESHTSESQKPFECSQCIQRLCNKSALSSHLKLHLQGKSGDKTYNCPICGENFNAVVTFKAHLCIHSVNGEYTCPSCSKKFPSYHKIRRHIRSYHAAAHPCQECGKVLPSVEKLKIHLLSHSDCRDVACPKCPKLFKRKDKMKEHLKRMHPKHNHNKIKRSTQKFIPKVNPSDYKQFMYKCYLCLLGFKRRGMLVNHLSKRHPGIPIESVPELNQPIVRNSHSYMCQYCGKAYCSTTKRKLHILKNHPGAELPQRSTMRNELTKTLKTFAVSCPWCPRQYATKAKLLQHQRHHHHHHFGLSKIREKESQLSLLREKSFESQQRESLNDSEDILSQAVDKISNKPLVYGLNTENTVVEIKLPSGPSDFNQTYPKQSASTSSCSEQVYVSPFVVSREGTYTVLTPDGSETFTLSLRNSQILPSVDAISVLTPEVIQSSSSSLVTLDSLQHSHFSQDDGNCNKDDSCIIAQDLSETTPVLIWQP